MKNLLRLRIFLRPYWLQISIAFFGLLISTGLSLVIPEIIGRVIDIGLQSGESRYMLNSGLIILGLGVIVALLAFTHRYLLNWISHKVSYDVRNRMYDHIQRLSFSYHDRTQSGQLISRTIEDVRSIEQFTGFGVVELLRITLLMVGVIVLLFANNYRLALISLVPVLPLVWITSNFGTKIGDLFLVVDNTLGELSTRLQENVTGVQVVRAFARERFEIDRFNQINRDLYHARLNVISEWSKVMPTSHLLVALSTVLILWFGGNMVLNGQMTLGEIVVFNSYVVMIAEPARQLVWLVNLSGEASAGVKRIEDVLKTPAAIKSPEDAYRKEPIEGQVEFVNASLQYRTNSRYALKEINLAVEPNKIIALIGATGSGKTSLVNVIPRFYDLTEGKVHIDGVDVREYDLVCLRRQIGIVLQTSLLFSTTIRQNIAYGRPDASLEDVVVAAKAAQAHDFILKMPDGYDTEVGERGVTLSGGQRQRVAIARALLMDPRILILDDSTSSVDIQTEQLIQKALDDLMEGRTTFVIAQRLSTVRRADQILVMDQGEIVERGVHDELIARDGIYRQIYDMQLRDQELSEEI